MKKKVPPPLTDAHNVDSAETAHAAAVYVLRLYITGSSPRSVRAISNLRKICDEYLKGRYDLEVVDLSQNPMLAKSEQIVAAPTLIRKLPLPVRRFVGDMSKSERFFVGLGLLEATQKTPVATAATAAPPHAH